MKTNPLQILLLALLATSACKQEKAPSQTRPLEKRQQDGQLSYALPTPDTTNGMPVEACMQNRRSRRRFSDVPVTADQLSQLLWAAYGVTLPTSGNRDLGGGKRTAPSAGALYPLEIYALVGKVKDIEPGVYKYVARDHSIVRVIDRDVRLDLQEKAMVQRMVAEAPLCLAYTAIFKKTVDKYGERGHQRYVSMDLGHSAQNVYLQAESLNLGTCAIGAFKDELVAGVLELPAGEDPIYLMPLGRYFE